MLLFVPKLPSSGPLELSREQVQHLKAKRNLYSGFNVTLSDGSNYTTGSLQVDSKKTTVEYKKTDSLPSRTDSFSLYFSIIKPDRMSWLIEKSTELGIDRLIPLETDRSQKHHWTGSSAQHLNKVILSACTQSQQKVPPLLEQPIKLSDALKKINLSENNIFYGSMSPQSQVLSPQSLSKTKKTVLLIGPEGGWSDPEENLLLQHGSPILYPGAILRTETAALALGSMILHLLHNHQNKS